MKIATSTNKNDLISIGITVDLLMGFPTKDGFTMRYAEVMQNTVSGLYGYCVDDQRAFNLAQTAGLTIIEQDSLDINWISS